MLLLLVVAAFPSWPYARAWGYTPLSLLVTVLLVVVVLHVLHVL